MCYQIHMQRSEFYRLSLDFLNNVVQVKSLKTGPFGTWSRKRTYQDLCQEQKRQWLEKFFKIFCREVGKIRKHRTAPEMLQDLFVLCVVVFFFLRVLKPCSLGTGQSQAGRDGGVGEKWARQCVVPTPRSEKEVARRDGAESVFYCQSFQFCWFRLNP